MCVSVSENNLGVMLRWMAVRGEVSLSVSLVNSHLFLLGSGSLSADQKDVLCWLFSPPHHGGLSEEPSLKAEDGERLIEIGPR